MYVFPYILWAYFYIQKNQLGEQDSDVFKYGAPPNLRIRNPFNTALRWFHTRQLFGASSLKCEKQRREQNLAFNTFC